MNIPSITNLPKIKLLNTKENLKSKQTKEEKDELKVYQKEKFEFTSKFYGLMFELGLYNKFNKTYSLKIYEKTNYGFRANLNLELGLTFTMLNNKIGDIQEGLCCIWIMRTEPFKDYAIINIVTNPLDYEILFENPKVKPWELYLGLDFSLDVIKNNNNDYCMALMAGATGSGKSRLLFMMILSWILSCSITEVEIYIADIIKDGFSSFKYAKHVKAYATDLEELLKILQYLKIKLDKRRKTISPLRENGIASNIVEFNKTQKVKMSYCYLCIDEFSFIMPDKTDRKEEKELKEEVLDLIKQFEKVGREMGIFILNGLQKAVKDELPSLIKSQSGLRISFRANDSISSEVIMGDNSAVGLMKRYAVYSKNGGEKNYLFSPKLTTERLKELLSPHIDKNYKKPDLYYTIKASKIPMQPPSRVTKIKNPIDIKDLHDRNKFKNIPYNLINSEGDEFNDY